MDRAILQRLSRERLSDARVLLRAKRYVAAYYLAGYSVECALKSCIAKQVARYDFPDKKLVNDSYSHDLVKLVGVAGLKQYLEVRQAQDKVFELNWTIVKDWSSEERYSDTISASKAQDFYSAISSRRTGIMIWLRTYW